MYKLVCMSDQTANNLVIETLNMAVTTVSSPRLLTLLLQGKW